jgi:hypothetical protein
MKYVIEVEYDRPRLIDERDIPAFLSGPRHIAVRVREATPADVGLYIIGCGGCAVGREHAHGETAIAGGAR